MKKRLYRFLCECNYCSKKEIVEDTEKKSQKLPKDWIQIDPTDESMRIKHYCPKCAAELNLHESR